MWQSIHSNTHNVVSEKYRCIIWADDFYCFPNSDFVNIASFRLPSFRFHSRVCQKSELPVAVTGELGRVEAR